MVKNAQKYNIGPLEAGDPVEVELNERPDGAAEFARGTVLKGRLISFTSPAPMPPMAYSGKSSASPRVAPAMARSAAGRPPVQAAKATPPAAR